MIVGKPRAVAAVAINRRREVVVGAASFMVGSGKAPPYKIAEQEYNSENARFFTGLRPPGIVSGRITLPQVAALPRRTRSLESSARPW